MAYPISAYFGRKTYADLTQCAYCHKPYNEVEAWHTLMTSEFKCSNCGATWKLEDDEWEPTLWLDGVACYPRFCQLCGMEIREDEDDR